MGTFFWVFDSFIDAVILHEGSFMSQLLSPASVEIWVRTFVLALFFSFSLIMSLEFKKRKQLFKALQHSEDAYRRTAKENELLLHEIHHRVKNNMQVISSICRLQSKQIEDENALNVLRNNNSRIHAMAYVHEHLYQRHTLSGVRTEEYLNSLIKSIFQIFEIKSDELNFSLSIDELSFNPDTLITLGLILNELISNSLKHAFRDVPVPELSVQVFKGNEGKYHLVYQDNGIGMPEKLSSSKTDSLGLFLIKSFVQRLDGTIRIDGSSGTIVHITF